MENEKNRYTRKEQGWYTPVKVVKIASVNESVRAEGHLYPLAVSDREQNPGNRSPWQYPPFTRMKTLLNTKGILKDVLQRGRLDGPCWALFGLSCDDIVLLISLNLYY
ncbi:hypothetical protein DINM_006992 [Dirofilaria immitis]|nr:hypothetical protein [Dirofilaria immitis]